MTPGPRLPFGGPSKPKDAGHYYLLEVPADLLDAFRDAIESRYVPTPAKEKMRSIVEGARRVDLQWAELPWSEVEAEARREGCSVADIIWDRAGRRGEK